MGPAAEPEAVGAPGAEEPGRESPGLPGQRLAEVAAVFLRLGVTAFGGPAAHIAMMSEEVVERRRWLDRQAFLDLLGATHLIPGPNSTELAIHLGYRRAGWPGLIVAGVCFILPAMLAVWALAVAYVRFQAVPQVGHILYGVKPVILAIVVHAVWGLARTAIKDGATAAAAAVVVALSLAGLHETGLLFGAGAAVMAWRALGPGRSQGRGAMAALAVSGAAPAAAGTLAKAGTATAAAAGAATAATAVGWPQVFWFFLKIGSVLYGSGYVLLAFLQKDLVERWGWLSSRQLLDAIAVGQFTPGPVFTTATFVGYLVAGHAGAVAATVGIFLPAFVFVALTNPWIPHLRRSRWAAGFLDGVNAASLALMVAVGWQLARSAVVDGPTAALAAGALAALWCLRVNSAWLVAAGGLVGALAGR